MSSPTVPVSPLPALNRRAFMRAATLAGAAAWTGPRLAAADAKPTPPAAAAAPAAKGAEGSVPLAPPDKQSVLAKAPSAPPKKVGWAVVGLGQLALEEIIPAFRECKISQPVALVSGHRDKAKQTAEAIGVPADAIYSYEDFDRIKDNPKIEAVYIVLPNSMHAEYTIRALRAGKHVFCEKPMAANVAEAEQMVAAAKQAGRKLGIAYRLHYEPMTQKVKEMCAKKTHGAVKVISCTNGQDTKPPNIRLSRALAGGPAQDIGIYCFNAARYFTGEEPVEVSAFATQPANDPRFREVPESIVFTLRFPSGALAHCDCSFRSVDSKRFHILTEKAEIEMNKAFAYRGLRLFVTDEEKREEITVRAVNQFTMEMDDFSRRILDNQAPLTPGEEGVLDMKVLAAIEESIKTGRPAKM